MEIDPPENGLEKHVRHACRNRRNPLTHTALHLDIPVS
jgi:hypothetical protein